MLLVTVTTWYAHCVAELSAHYTALSVCGYRVPVTSRCFELYKTYSKCPIHVGRNPLAIVIRFAG